MYTTKTWLYIAVIVSLFFACVWASAKFLTGVYYASAHFQATVPSIGLLYLSVFLFWFVLFLIPNWEGKDADYDII